MATINWRKTRVNVIRKYFTTRDFAKTVQGCAEVTVRAILIDNGTIPANSLKREIVVERLREDGLLVEEEKAA